MDQQFAIIGLGSFGRRTLEKLSEASDQILIVDNDKAVVEAHKDLAAKSYVANAINQEALERIVPQGLDVAVVDLGDNLEAAIMVTNTLKKLGVRKIIVRADSEERGEVLRIVGASTIVYPAKDAADKLVPMLISKNLLSFMPISPSLVLAEIKVPERYVDLSLVEANFRQSRGVNVVAIRKEDGDEYVYFNPKYRLQADDVMLCAGTEEHIGAFTGTRVAPRKTALGEMLKGIFGQRKAKRADSKLEEKPKQA